MNKLKNFLEQINVKDIKASTYVSAVVLIFTMVNIEGLHAAEQPRKSFLQLLLKLLRKKKQRLLQPYRKTTQKKELMV